jgi:hypothetical protein
MKIKLDKFFYGSILLQIIATQGVLTFIIFKFLGNWELKKILHPLSFIFIITIFILKATKKIKITLLDVLLLGYLCFQIVFLIYNIESLKSFYIAFREFYFIFILIFIFSQIVLRQYLLHKLLNVIFYLVIINSVFIALTYALGSEDYMKMLTGRYVWGIDPDYKFKIATFYKFWRSPALIGNAASVGYFGLFAYLLMDTQEKFKKKRYFTLILVLFSFVRSVFLVILVYEFLKFFTLKKNLKKLLIIFKIGVPILIFMFLYLTKYDIFSTESLYARYYLWSNQINVDYNIFYGGAIGNIGGGVRGDGFIETLDSYWLFMFLSSGLIGVVLSSLFIYEKSKKNKKFLFILIGFLLAGFLVNLTQSIVFLVLFPMLFLKIKEDKPELNEHD